MPKTPPIAILRVSNLSPDVGQVIQFDASGSSAVTGKINQWHIDFGDGDGAGGAGLMGTMSKSYETADTFVATLQIWTNQGLHSSATATITVRDVAAPPPPAPVDCVWGPWVTVSEQATQACQPDGTQTWSITQHRTVATPAANGGAACTGPSDRTITETRPCVYVPPPPIPTGGGNTYYNALTQLTSFSKGYPLRSQAEVDQFKQNSRPGVSYDTAMDATRVVIPCFMATSAPTTLSAAVGPSDTVWPVTLWDASGLLVNRLIRVDAEAVLITTLDKANNRITVVRAQAGTTAVSHAAGVPFFYSTNSLQNQMRMPMGTTDGHVWVITWDARFDRSHLNTGGGGKVFQLTSGGDSIWFETQRRIDTRYAPGFDPSVHFGGVTARTYNALGGAADWTTTNGNAAGPIVTKADPVLPIANTFLIVPDRWVRYWIVIDQRANDYDYIDYWVADEQRDPVKVYSQIPVSVRPTGSQPNQIVNFWIEQNSSEDRWIRGDLRDLVSWVRNVVVLKDPADVPSLLIKP